MVMLRPSGKPYKIAKKILANKGVKVAKPKEIQATKQTGPFLYHQEEHEKESNEKSHENDGSLSWQQDE